LVFGELEIYNRSMGNNRIEKLLQAANSSSEGDTSINSAKRTFLSEDDAAEYFRSVGAKLFRIEEWQKSSSPTTYDLFDQSGQAVTGPIETGMFIRIGLYGAGKYDWVRVDEIVRDPSEIVLRVKPSHDPTDPDRADSISHFFRPEAENNFCVQLDEKTVAFYVIGINEKQNTEFTDGLIESARNVAVANVGYYSGLQKAVWKEFAINFLRTDEEKAE
jgi:hypothetical protein